MCGISALYRFTNISSNDCLKLEAMNKEMAYRGPNEKGVWHDDICGLAHTRLSIIGLENGHQPIFNEDRSLVLVCNGEIYNYKDLKSAYDAKDPVAVMSVNNGGYDVTIPCYPNDYFTHNSTSYGQKFQYFIQSERMSRHYVIPQASGISMAQTPFSSTPPRQAQAQSIQMQSNLLFPWENPRLFTQESQTGFTNFPIYMRSVTSVFPASYNVYSQMKIPLGIVIQPAISTLLCSSLRTDLLLQGHGYGGPVTDTMLLNTALKCLILFVVPALANFPF